MMQYEICKCCGKPKRPKQVSKRFPANLLLSHSVWCIPIGTKRVRANGPSPDATGNKSSDIYQLGLKTNSPISYRDADGMETIEAWECDASCPIAELDRQSGVRAPGYRKNPSTNKTTWFGATNGSHIEGERGYKDTGGASRYFSQFSPDVPVPYKYVSKASRAERNMGCEGLPFVTPSRIAGLGSHRVNRCPEHNATLPSASNHYECGCKVIFENNDAVTNKELPRSNHHPCVKPLALCQWLIRLVTPPGGTVLDCFAGSGSTLCAAIYEGVHFIGIEAEAEYVAIAESRIAHAYEEVRKSCQ